MAAEIEQLQDMLQDKEQLIGKEQRTKEQLLSDARRRHLDDVQRAEIELETKDRAHLGDVANMTQSLRDRFVAHMSIDEYQ